VCGRHVDRRSPFFEPAPARGAPVERVNYRLLDLGESVDDAARALFLGLCARKQALSPDDREALTTLAGELRGRTLPWVPAVIPVRENVALIFGTLLTTCPPDDVRSAAERHLKTATDVLRLVAVMSGADGSLQPERVLRGFLRSAAYDAPGPHRVPRAEPGRFTGAIAAKIEAPQGRGTPFVSAVLRVRCFKVARLRRPLRRALLALLERLHPDRLVEDMLRHRSAWVRVGEHLHPGEHAARFPHVARAFTVLRGKAPDGIPAPLFHAWSSRLEAAVNARDTAALTALLEERPGELGRRFDHALRVAGDDDAAVDRVVSAFTAHAPALATPLLATLRAQLPTRSEKASVRVYWPKGKVARGVSAPDARAPLPPRAIDLAVRAVDAELLRRFAEKPPFADAVIDDALALVVAPSTNARRAPPP
jgi:hypothetical protein